MQPTQTRRMDLRSPLIHRQCGGTPTVCLSSISPLEMGGDCNESLLFLIFNPLSRAIICDRETGFQNQRQGVQLNVRHLILVRMLLG